MFDTAVSGSALRLDPGDHICAFYRGPAERDEIMLPFLQDGLRAGHKCVCVVDSCDPDHVRERLDVEPMAGGVADDQLEVLDSDGTYLAGGGFLPERMLTFWNARTADCLRDGGFSFVRNVGDMTWAHTQKPGVGELIGYESELNRLMSRYPQVNLCLYDLNRCSADLAMDVLKTHPKVLMAGMVLENPYYLEPEEFLAARARKNHQQRP